MKIITLSIYFLLVILFSLNFFYFKSGPIISNLTYDNITQTSVTVYWTTDSPSDSKIKWMASDSNYQLQIFTDSIYNPAAVTNHAVPIGNLQPAKIYKYNVISQNVGGVSVDSGYFVTQSNSSGRVDVYFNHTVDTTVSTGEKAKGNQDFAIPLVNRIDSAQYSIDITLWEFKDITSVCTALINAKNRGVKIRFIYNDFVNTDLMDTLNAYGIPILKRFQDTLNAMHNKFWIFDYRYNSNSNKKFLWTSSANVTHPQFHSDRNNVIVIQDESLCAVYTREFEEMWGSHTDQYDSLKAKFGPFKINNVPHILNVAGTRMEVYFIPSDSVVSFLNNLILSKTTKSLFFSIFKYSISSYENSMHTVFNNGKQIKGVFDFSHSVDSGSVYSRMKGISPHNPWNPHADVFLDTISGLMHHKYLIIDANSSSGNKTVETGSYNWDMSSSTANDDNSITIFSSRINNLYYQEFYARYRGAGGEIIGIQKIGSEIPTSFSLYQNYPNPFNPITNMKYQIRNNTLITLKIFDILGKEVSILVNEKQSAGTYEVKWDGSNYSSGIYFYTLTAGDYKETKRMVLLK